MKTARRLVILTVFVLISLSWLPGAPILSDARASSFPSGFTPTYTLAPSASGDSTWFSLGAGLASDVNVIKAHGTDLYVGGNFIDADGNPAADHIARWDGLAWHPLAAGLNNAVQDILFVGSDIYVGGAFDTSWGGGVADHIVRWDGAAWHSLGSGLNQPVYALAASGSDIYVGGSFTNAGGNAAGDYIARWDGAAWQPLGGGLNDYVLGLAVIGTNLYACGGFTDAGGDPNADHIARWDGSSWHALGAGLNDVAQALAASGTNLYVGGNFIAAGGDPTANFIARWDGSAWHPIGGNTPPTSSIAPAGTTIYAGIRPSRWDGAVWQQLDSSFTGQAKAIAVTEDGVYVGGNFTDLGGNSNADYIALWQGVRLTPDTMLYSRYDAAGPTRQVRMVSENGADDRLLLNGSFPRLSPNGYYVAFLKDGGYPPNHLNSIYVRNLTNYAESRTFANGDYIVGYDWTNDSRQLVFDHGCAIDRMNPDGTGQTHVVVGDCDNDAPSSNPWDSSLAFHNVTIGIRVSDKNGGGVTNVPNTGPGDFWPSWSPDGQWISFLHGQPSGIFGGGNYYKIRPDGTGLTQLSHLQIDDNNHMNPAGEWAPDGDHLVVPGMVNGQWGIYAIPTSGSGSLVRIPAQYGAQADFVGAIIGDINNLLHLPLVLR